MPLSSEQEAHLIQRAQSGTPDSTDAINQLLSAYRDQLYQFAKKALGDHDKAEDAVQSTMIFAWYKLKDGKYAPSPAKPNGFQHWLLALCKNRNYDVMAGRQSDDRMLYQTNPGRQTARINRTSTTPTFHQINNNVDLERALHQFRAEDATSNAAAELAQIAELVDTIPSKKLTPSVRRIFRMYLDGLSPEEIASDLAISRRSVQQVLSRARREIRIYVKTINKDVDCSPIYMKDNIARRRLAQ